MSGHFDLRLKGDDIGEVAMSAFGAVSQIVDRLCRASRHAKVQALRSQEVKGGQVEEQRYDFRNDIIKVLEAEQLIDVVKASSDGVGCDVCVIRCRDLLEKMAELRSYIETYSAAAE